jgi:hypothetical protein
MPDTSRERIQIEKIRELHKNHDGLVTGQCEHIFLLTALDEREELLARLVESCRRRSPMLRLTGRPKTSCAAANSRSSDGCPIALY